MSMSTTNPHRVGLYGNGCPILADRVAGQTNILLSGNNKHGRRIVEYAIQCSNNISLYCHGSNP